MPKAFSDAGWLLSVTGVIILAFVSYLTATFMIEAMAAANALERFKSLKQYKRVSRTLARIRAENALTIIFQVVMIILIGLRDSEWTLSESTYESDEFASSR